MTIKIDRSSIPRGYRDYLKKMMEMGEFFEIHDVVRETDNAVVGAVRIRMMF